MKKTACTKLEELSEEGNWEQVFYCLGIDPDGFRKLPQHKVPDVNDSWNKFDWLREHQETMKILRAVLHVILICDQFLICLCLFYVLSLVYKLICHRIFARKRAFEIENSKTLS